MVAKIAGRWFVLCAVLPVVLAPLAMAAPSDVGPNYVLLKDIKSNQTDPSTVILSTNPYRIQVFVQATSNGSITGGTVTLATGSGASSPGVLVAQNDGTGAYQFQDKFAAQSTLNTQYADGTYGISITGSTSNYSANLTLSGGVYPTAAPQVTNTNWSGGNLLIDPTTGFNLTWNPFAGGGANDRIVLTLRNTVSNQSVMVQFLASSATSFLLPAGTFQLGQSYQGGLIFIKGSGSPDTTSIAGATGFAGYDQQTNFQIATVPEAGMTAMLMTGAVSLWLMRILGRRKTGSKS